MIKSIWRPKSIVSRLTILVFIMIILQTVFLAGTLIVGGVFKEAQQKAYQSFYDTVHNRNEFVQREMKNKWTNLEPYVNTIEKSISGDSQDYDLVLRGTMDHLIDMLRTTQVTGAYIILNNDSSIQTQRYPSLYIRDYDPLSNIYSDDDIYMVAGSSDLAKEYKIPLDQTWQYQLKLNEDNQAFFLNPFTSASLSSKSELLGYWSRPFRLTENDLPIITYSMPLFDASNQLKGIIGIEVTLNYFTDFFPASDLQPKDSLGYLIAFRDSESDALTPIVTEGALQKRMIQDSSALELRPVDVNRMIYELENHLGKETIYACVEKVGLYQLNTPFENEEWYLVGLMREDYLLNYVTRIQQILMLSLLVSIILGAIGGIIISFQMSKPITHLAKVVKASDKNSILHLGRTGLNELDALSQAIETANKAMLDSASRLSRIIEIVALPIGAFELNQQTGTVFVTDQFYAILGVSDFEPEAYTEKKAFQNLLETTFIEPEPEEEHVYRIPTTPERWVRLNVTISEDLIIGVVMDVTDEILDKLAIRRDRDLDPLTKLLNRKGFQWQFDLQNNQNDETAALLMFDLDNLKLINDTYGHKWGDSYILKAVERLDSIADQEHKVLGRRSGDEFVLLLHHYDSKESLIKTVDAFFDTLNSHLLEFPDGTRKPVTISAGLMWIENSELTYDELLHYADEALYEAKRHNKGSYIVSEYF